MDQAEFDAFLTDISECFISENFQLWADRIVLPFSVVTKTGPIVSYDLEGLEADFNRYLEACHTMKLDLVHRIPISIEHCEDGTVICTYRTELLSHGQRATEPFTSSALMSQVDGRWRMTAILNARGHSSWTGHSPHREGGRHMIESQYRCNPTFMVSTRHVAAWRVSKIDYAINAGFGFEQPNGTSPNKQNGGLNDFNIRFI